jgi:hypothetical protein
LGRRAEALSLARVAAHEGIGDTLKMVAAAETFSLLGETEEAVAALEAAVEAGYGDVYLLLIDPLLGGLTDHPALDRLAPVS